MTYNLFISHSWSYSDQYNTLKRLLDEYPDFNYKNYSVPKDDPIHNAANDRELRKAIKRQMEPCSVILMMAGVYSTYSKWINEEIILAKSFKSPKAIIAVEGWGSKKTSEPVKEAAQKVVRWNSKSIVNAIKELAR